MQEASRMFLCHVLEQTIGNCKHELRVLDLCAAPGGKTTLLASCVQDGLIVANEVIKSRASVLVENITKWGCNHVVVTNNDPADFAQLDSFFDVLVGDAPCSGSGLFRKDPEAVAEWSLANVQLCSQRQQRILADVYPALKPGGLIIYSTCSYSREEDEAICDWLANNFSVSVCRIPVDPSWGVVETVPEKGVYGYRFYPDKLKGEGFFIAAVYKNDGEEKQHKHFSTRQLSANEIAPLQDWVKQDAGLAYMKQSESIIVVPQQWLQDIGLLQKKLYLRKAGITIGAIKGKGLVPHHDLALSHMLSGKVSRLELTLEQAVKYLQKKDFLPQTESAGWAAVSFCGIIVGWVKVLHNRVNNYYPSEWRILKD